MENSIPDLDAKIPANRLKPFITLEKYLDDDFKKFVNRLTFLIREHGITKVPKPLRNPKKFKKFIGSVHEGWKKAHLAITEILLEKLAIWESLKDSKGDSDAKRLIIEIRILRRIYDSIAWAMLDNEHSTIRRLSVRGGQNNFSAKNIRDAALEIDELNKDPQKIAISSDITSFVHIGDILVLDKLKGITTFVELKSGDKNFSLSQAATFAVDSGCALFEELTKSAMPQKDKKHFDRLKKQYARASSVVEVIKNEKGIDHNTGMKVNIHSLENEVQLYSQVIVACYKDLNSSKTWSIATVDGCLHVGVYSDTELAFVAFNTWIDGIGCTSPIYNLTDSFFDPTVRPFFSLDLPLELLRKVFNGEVTIILCLDLRAFIEVGNKMYPELLYLGTKKESAETTQKPYVFALLDGRVIKAKTKGDDLTMGHGIIDRIIFDLQRPKTAIENLYALSIKVD